MVWIDAREEKKPFRGETTYPVINPRTGRRGRATIQYYASDPSPVVLEDPEDIEKDEDGWPAREAQVIDSRPTIRTTC